MRAPIQDEIIANSLVGSASLIQFCFAIYFYQTLGDKRMLCLGLISIVAGVLYQIFINLPIVATNIPTCATFYIVGAINYYINGWAPRILYGLIIESLMFSLATRFTTRLLMKSYLMAIIFIPLDSLFAVYDVIDSDAYKAIPITHRCPLYGTISITVRNTTVSIAGLTLIDVWQVILFVVAIRKLRLQKAKFTALKTVISAYSLVLTTNVLSAFALLYLPEYSAVWTGLNLIVSTVGCLFPQYKNMFSKRVHLTWGTYLHWTIHTNRARVSNVQSKSISDPESEIGYNG